MTTHTRTSSTSSQTHSRSDVNLSISPTQFDGDTSFSPTTNRFFKEHTLPASAKIPPTSSAGTFPHHIPMPIRSMSATTSSNVLDTPTIRSPPRGGGSQTKRHSMRSSPPSTPVAQGHSSSSTATNSDKPSRSLFQNNNNNNNSSNNTNNHNTTPIPRPHSPPTTTPPSIHKSINALDAKSITLNMEKSTQQMRAAVASVAAAAAAAANAKYHSNPSSEEFHVASPNSPTYSHHPHHPSSSFFGSSSSSSGHHYTQTYHHHSMIHSPSAGGAPLPPTPITHPLHAYHRQGSISSITHPNTSTQSINNGISGINSSNSGNYNNNNSTSGNNGDLWQSLCVRVLPLFNGEGVQGSIEYMNDLLRQCLSDPISPQLYHDIESLLHDGMFTLNAKMFGVTDEKLLDRLVEQWSFFFTYALPYFEAVFLPLRTDVRYRSQDEAEMWNVRNMALQSFRDNVILLQIKRLEDVFNKLFTDFGSSQNPAAKAAKMLQMTSVLASAPDHNEELDRVLSNLKANWKIMMNKGDRRGFAGVRRTRAGPPLNDKMFG